MNAPAPRPAAAPIRRGGVARRRWLVALASLAGALLVGGAGFVLQDASLTGAQVSHRPVPRFGWIARALADGLAHLSYDLPFVLRGQRTPPEACIVYVDEYAARELKQGGERWDRDLHAQLVRRLTAQGARAVLFDIVFAEPWRDPAVDETLAAAMRENGRVFLGAALEASTDVGGSGERTLAPTPVLRRAAAGWGLLSFQPVDADYGVRRIFPGTETIPAASAVAARGLGAVLPPETDPRWLNYYGRAGIFPTIDFARAIAPDGPPDFFRGRVVVVGGRATLGGYQLSKDEFRNPYTLVGAQFTTGAEVHLTALVNLLTGDWLTRLSPRRECALVLLVGLLLGAGLPWARPNVAAVVSAISVGVFVATPVWLLVEEKAWFVWAVPALIQTPLALLWAVGTRYFIEERRRFALREAFARYLSPQFADRIADADFDLSLGGSVVEATVLFTDLEGFTALSEQLDHPKLISEVLTTYFTQTTHHILENDGTIIKYMGDAVQAVWGAPLPDPAQARKAVLAAWRMHRADDLQVQGHPLHTRIGINTGQMLSGNLGSAQRFDYAVTGDAVNFAARLEGLNKHLGTAVLISDTVEAQVRGEFQVRRVGEFRVSGKKLARVVYELLGPVGEGAAPHWLPTFERALEWFGEGDLIAAEAAFHQTITLRGADGPSAFYLKQVADLRQRGLPPDWSGIVDLLTK